MADLSQVVEFYFVLKNVPWSKVNSADLQKWIDDPQRLAIELPEFLKNFPQADTAETQREVQQIFRRLYEDETITLAPCDGYRFIGEQKKTFAAGIEVDVVRWNLNNPSAPTDATKIAIHEMIKDATFAQMFHSLGSDLDKLCLTQHQIVEFCEKHPDKLLQDDCTTFFLFKRNADFFVAGVGVHSIGLRVYVYRFDRGDVWLTDYARRVVTPQLTV